MMGELIIAFMVLDYNLLLIEGSKN